MQLIMNEYSLCGQFNSIDDDFTEYFKSTLRPVLDASVEKNVPLLKKTDFYNRSLTAKETVQDVLRRTNDPISTLWKKYISQMAFTEPYWDNDIKTRRNSDYQYPMTDEFPNCFTEAMERNAALFSFPCSACQCSEFLCSRDGEEFRVNNIYAWQQFLQRYLFFHMDDIRYVLENYPYSNGIAVECVQMSGTCHADVALQGNALNYGDYIEFMTDIPRLWNDLINGRKTVLWDTFGNGLFEYRRNVSDRRIFRIFFTISEKKIYFFNGFIKKTQSTPKKELNMAKDLLRQWKK